MDRYLDDEAATSATKIDGWHRTGDLGTLDPEGYLTIVGRLTDMIITGGFNVYPAEIEGVIAERPDVHESAVIGLPDPDWGERIVAVVEPAPGAVVDTDDLLRHVRSRPRSGEDTEGRGDRRRHPPQRQRQDPEVAARRAPHVRRVAPGRGR